MHIKKTHSLVRRSRNLALLATGTLLIGLGSGIATAGPANAEAATANQQNSAATPDAPAALGKVYDVGGEVKPPVLVYAPDPVFPKRERKAGKSGVCVVGLIVDEKGSPQQVDITRPLGPDFDKSAIQAVEKYRFRPATLNGTSVAVNVQIEVNFRFTRPTEGGANQQNSATTSDSPAAPGKVYDVGGDVQPPVLVYAPDPVFPKRERRAKESGVCIVDLIVDEKGFPQQVHITQPLGPDFDESAIEAVKKYRFRPATLKGASVAVKTRIEVNFILRPS